MFEFQYNRVTVALPLALMALDIVAGFICAWAKKKVNTSVMRKGLAKKFGEILVILVANVIYYTMGVTEMVLYGTTIYISAMEFLSICENLKKLGVEVPKVLTDIFDKKDGGETK